MREKINWKVEENDIRELIEPTYIEIPIDKGQYHYIFNDNKIKGLLPEEYFKRLESDIVDRLFTKDVYDKYRTLLKDKISLSFIPNFKDGTWLIGYSPIEIYNNIFKILGITRKVDYTDYSNAKMVEEERYNINNILSLNISLLTITKAQSDKVEFMKDARDSIDKIFMFNGYDIESRMKDRVVYKNLLYYLSVKSLDRLDETDDIRYGLIPKMYYNEVTTKNKAEWPNQLFMGDVVYAYNFKNYNDRFNKVLMRYPILFEEELGMDKIGVMNQIDIVKADNFIDDVRTVYNNYAEIVRRKKTYTKDDYELNSMLVDKVNFYRELLNMKDDSGNNIVVSPIKGKNNLYGYYGFVLNNNYVVLDKFFNIRATDNKIKPAKDEAIYTMPLDLFKELNGSKRQMMEYIRNNPKGDVKRYYHTKKHSYRDRILSITKKEDVSTLKYNWFLPIYTEETHNKLVLKK